MEKNDQLIIKYLIQIRNEVRELKLASKEVLTMKEATEYTGYSKSYLYRLVSNKAIPNSKPNGKSVFFERKVLEQWLLSKPNTAMSKNEEKARKLLRKNN